MEKVTPASKMEILCSTCGQGNFLSLRAFKLHSETHEEESIYTCKKCDEIFYENALVNFEEKWLNVNKNLGIKLTNKIHTKISHFPQYIKITGRAIGQWTCTSVFCILMHIMYEFIDF